MAKVTKKRWRPSVKMVRGLQREIADAAVKLGEARDLNVSDRAARHNHINELTHRVDSLAARLRDAYRDHVETKTALIRALQPKGWWERFWSLFGL